MAQPKEPRREPTPQERAAAVRFLLVGVVLALAIVWVLGNVLDAESKNTLLWAYGRHAAVLLAAWVGWSIGLGRGKTVADNLECLAIAVVMALVLKHFLVEAYKIPTGSMQPTILGNEESGIFDRVLVNKFSYLIDEPERFDVVVFKYPLDRSKNYIKRVGGLPGEQVTIHAGNLYVAVKGPDGRYGEKRVARKPPEVRAAVAKRLYPSGLAGEGFATAFSVMRGRVTADGDQVVLGPDAAFRYGHGDSIRDRYLDGYDPDWGIPAPFHVPEHGTYAVSDFGIALDVTPEAGAEELALVVFANGLEHRAVLGVGAGRGARLESGSRRGDSVVPLAGDSPVVATTDTTLLAPGETTRVRFQHVDQELILEVDGEVVLSHAYELPLPIVTSENALEVELAGAGATLADLEVFRDIHYTSMGDSNQQVFEIPDDALLVLGDNTQNSSDSRAWAAQRVRFPDGTEVIRERGIGRGPGEFVDVYGERYRTDPRAYPSFHDLPDRAFSYVPRDLLLGKAIAVFWPIYPHFRWKLIR